MNLQLYFKKKIYQKKTKNNALILFFIIACTLCTSSFSNNQLNNVKTFNKNVKDTVPLLFVGEGYLSYDGQGVGESAIDTSKLKVIYGQPQNTLNLSQTMSQEEIANDLNVKVSGSISYGLFSASASADYMKNTKDTNYSQNINYGESYNVKKLLDISPLTHDIAGLSPQAQELYNTDPSRFTSVYGDNFIQEVTKGVLLLVDVKLSFASAEDKQSFDAAMSASYGAFGSVSAEIKTAQSQSKAKGSVQIYAYQLGGKPEELATVMAGKSSTGDYYVSTCSLTNFDSCSHIIDGIINYAAGPLSKQVQLTGDTKSDNLAVIGQPVLKSYHMLFGIAYPRPLDPEVLEARKQLVQLYNQQNDNKILFNHILNIPYYINPEISVALLSRTNSNLQLFNQAVKCYRPGAENLCSMVLNDIRSSINIDSDIINTIKKYYIVDSDWQNLSNALDVSHVTAAYYDGSLNHYYFFLNNGEYTRFSDSDALMDSGYPIELTDHSWPGLKTDIGSATITAVLYDPHPKSDKTSYFFLGNGTYIAYDSTKDTVYSSYPREVNDETWPGLKEDVGTNQIVGAFYKDGKDYFFLSNGEYIIYNALSNIVEPGYPKKI